MGRPALIEAIEAEQLKKEIPEFRIGDNLKISFKIIEGGKERIQSLTGTVVARKGSGLSENITLYRTAYGSAMERVFMLHSPRITDIAVVRKGKVRRSKLYYICGVMGKASKVKERIGKKSIVITEDVKAETNNTAAKAENN
ncbi:MAG: 50S ribosomal protein L19 [Simkaniaceae bacterium]|nr:50S ribosomal protein L19 [Simkaniaceae bacterium]